MTIRHLKVFIKVCELNSISKAADQLCVAQPSVSQTIKELERYYNVILFDRVSKKIILTKEGETLLAKAKEVVEQFDNFELLANKGISNPVIRIGATISFGEKILPKLIKDFKINFPEAKPLIRIDKASVLEEKVLCGDLDFAIVEGIVSNRALKTIQVAEDTLCLVASPNYKVPNKIKLADLVNYNLLLREPDSPCRKIFDYQLALRGVKIQCPSLESISNNAIIEMALSGSGIGVLPANLVKTYIEKGTLVKIDFDIPLNRRLYVITTSCKQFNQLGAKIYKYAISSLKNTQIE